MSIYSTQKYKFTFCVPLQGMRCAFHFMKLRSASIYRVNRADLLCKFRPLRCATYPDNKKHP